MDAKREYLSEIFSIINQLYGDVDEKLVIRKFCSRSLRFLYGLEDKYRPVKIRMQKENFCKESDYLWSLRHFKKKYQNHRKIIARFLEDIVFGIVMREILDCDVERNPALFDLYVDFRDGMDLSYKEEDVLDAIESKKSREELKKDFEEVIKFYQDKIQELEIYSKGLNHIKSFLQKELTLEDILYLEKWGIYWADLKTLEHFFQYFLRNRYPTLRAKYQRAAIQNSVDGLTKASESIKLLFSDIINTVNSGVKFYQPVIKEKLPGIKTKMRVEEREGKIVLKPPLEERIIELLHKKRMDSWNLSQTLKESAVKVTTTLYDMEKKGMVTAVGIFWTLSKEKKGS